MTNEQQRYQAVSGAQPVEIGAVWAAETALLDWWQAQMIRDARRFGHRSHIALIRRSRGLANQSRATRQTLITQAMGMQAR